MTNASIHASAIVDPDAQLGERVRIGPHAVIGAGVRIGDDCEVGASVVLSGPLTLGARNRLHAHAVLGEPPQDVSYRDEPTQLVVGDDNTFREFVTVHRASTKEAGVTAIGDRNLLMVASHVGHDCQLGNDIIIANSSQLGGHVHIDDRAYISAACAIHQFVHIGALAMLGGGAIVSRDVAPYCMAAGNRARLRGLNVRGLKRAGISPASQRALKAAYRAFFRAGHGTETAIAAIEAGELHHHPEVARFVAFVRASERGILR